MFCFLKFGNNFIVVKNHAKKGTMLPSILSMVNWTKYVAIQGKVHTRSKFYFLLHKLSEEFMSSNVTQLHFLDTKISNYMP